MGGEDNSHFDKAAVRALADGLGTAGQEIAIIGRGGALADGMADALAGAGTPGAYQAVARRADKAMDAVGTSLLEMGGLAVAAIVTHQQLDDERARGIDTATEGVR
ncbi:hypothetical protein [Nocardia crassostreae]|uniref:hypothetical protein n=1 Tax=Nocardia crassostreae TaxID=53428 RepID=UPI00082D4B34|nr:hypothetical protein [Nocardia crassostreae]